MEHRARTRFIAALLLISFPVFFGGQGLEVLHPIEEQLPSPQLSHKHALPGQTAALTCTSDPFHHCHVCLHAQSMGPAPQGPAEARTTASVSEAPRRPQAAPVLWRHSIFLRGPPSLV